jgi:hypothetical protein
MGDTASAVARCGWIPVRRADGMAMGSTKLRGSSGRGGDLLRPSPSGRRLTGGSGQERYATLTGLCVRVDRDQANVGRKATVSRRVLRTHSMQRNLNLILFFWRWAKRARLTYATRCPTDVLRSAAPWRWTFFDTVAGCVASLRPGSPLSVTGASSEWTSPVP